jgi:hypothetical protein
MPDFIMDLPPVPPQRDAANASAVPAPVVGRFVIRDLLGEGAAGLVFLADDPLLQRQVALKIPKFAAADTQRDERFLREAKSAARLRHPAIVAVYEGGWAGHELYIASEYVSGRTLAQVFDHARSPAGAAGNIAEAPDTNAARDPTLIALDAQVAGHPFSMRQAVDWVADLADALAYAHQEGIVHRDIKPGNVMIDAAGRPRLMDFGLARRITEESTLTTEGHLLGTPAYMSPEQARGSAPDVGPQSDQYSLGVVLYELLTGRLPFDGPPHVVIPRVILEAPTPLRRIDRRVPRDLEVICLKCLAKSPVNRYPSCRELVDDLHRWLRGDPIDARRTPPLESAWRWARRHRLAAGLAAAVVVLLGGIAAISSAAALSLSRDRAAKEESLTELSRQQEEEDRLHESAEKEREEAEKQSGAANQKLLAAREFGEKAEENRQLAEKTLDNLKEKEAGLASLKKEHEVELARRGELKSTATEANVKAREARDASEAKLRKFRDDLKNADPFTHYTSMLVFVQQAIVDRDYDLARELLADCDKGQRGWEWDYLHTRLANTPVPGWTAAGVAVKYVAPSRNVKAASEARYYEARKHRYAIFSPDGQLLACIDGGNRIMLFDARTGANLQTLIDNSRRAMAAAARGRRMEPFFAVDFSPDSQRVAAMSRNRVVVWERESGAILSTVGASESNLTTDELGGSLWDGMGYCDNLAMGYGPNGRLLLVAWDRALSELVKPGKVARKQKGLVKWTSYGMSLWDGETGSQFPLNKTAQSLVTGLNNFEFVLSTSDGLMLFKSPHHATFGQAAGDAVVRFDLKTGIFDLPDEWTWPFDVTEAHNRLQTRAIHKDGIWNVKEEKTLLPLAVLLRDLGLTLDPAPPSFSWSSDNQRIVLVIGKTVRVVHAPPGPAK